MLTDKEKKFIEVQRKRSKFSLIGSFLILSAAMFLFFKIINFRFNLTEICGACKIPPELRAYLISSEQFRCIFQFSMLPAFAAGLLIGFLFCFVSVLVNYMTGKKWLRIVDKLNLC